jgi:hypothetical protein
MKEDLMPLPGQSLKVHLSDLRQLFKFFTYFAGKVRVKVTPLSIQERKSFAVLWPSGATMTQPFIGLPVMSKGFVFGIFRQSS